MTQPILENETITTEDGFIVLIETGEVVGMAELKPQFVVDSRESAEWVLNRIGLAQADVQAVESTAAVIHARAVIANAEKLAKERQRRVDWLLARFENELAHWAKQALEETGGKSKTVKTVYGSISLRTVKGGLRVKDEGYALMVAQEEGFTNAIKTTEKFLISGLTDTQREYIESKLRKLPSNDNSFGGQAFEIKPDSESVKIETSVSQ